MADQTLPIEVENERIRKLLEGLVNLYRSRQEELAHLHQILAPVFDKVVGINALQRLIIVNEQHLHIIVSTMVPDDQVDSYIDEHYRKPLNLPASRNDSMFDMTTAEGVFIKSICDGFLQADIFNPEKLNPKNKREE